MRRGLAFLFIAAVLGACGGGGGDGATIQTSINQAPRALSNVAQPTFEFTSTGAGATFEVSLDGGPFELAGDEVVAGPEPLAGAIRDVLAAG